MKQVACANHYLNKGYQYGCMACLAVSMDVQSRSLTVANRALNKQLSKVTEELAKATAKR